MSRYDRFIVAAFLSVAVLVLLAVLPATAHAALADEPPVPPVYPGADRVPESARYGGAVIHPDEELCKDCEVDPEAVAPVQAATAGGPDAFGYTFLDSDEPSGPIYDFIDISDTGTQVFLFDDSYTDAIPLGFDFPFYGEIRNEIHIGSNGLIGFAPDSLWSLSNSCPLPEEFPPNEIIALQWDDLLPAASGPIAYQSFGRCPYGESEACWIVQYTDMLHFNFYPVGTFQAILFQGGDVLLQYADPGIFGGGSATMGIENGAGTIGLTYACNTENALAAERAVLFTPKSLTISKQASETAPEPGTAFSYAITLRNSLDETVSDLVLSDSLPPDVTLIGPVTLAPAHDEADAAQNAADLPNLVDGLTLAAGEEVTVTVPVSLTVGSVGPRQNQAALFGDQLDEILVAATTINALPDCGQIADNPIQNCSFEQGDLSGWVVSDIAEPLLPLEVAGAGVDVRYGLFTSDPPRGDFALVNGFDGEGPGVIEVAQDVTLPVDATGLAFLYRIGYDLETYFANEPRTFSVVIQPEGGGAYPLDETLIYTAMPRQALADSGDQVGQVDLSPFAGTAVRIVFRWRVPEAFSGPAMAQLDNVFLLQAGAPQFVNKPITLAREDELYRTEAVVTTFDPGAPAKLTALELPAWISFTDQLDGTAVISGTPAAADVGDHQLTLEAVSAEGRTVQTATVTVFGRNDPPTFARRPFEFAVPGQLYESTAVAEDEEGDALDIQIIELPEWLDATLDGNRRLALRDAGP